MINQVDADAAKLMKSLVALGLQASNAPPTATGATAAAAATTARHKANIQQDEKSQPVYRSNEYPSTGELTESGSEPESSSDTSRRRPKAAIDGGKKQTAIRVSGTNGTAAPPKAAPKKAAKAVPVKKSTTTAVPVKKSTTAVPVKKSTTTAVPVKKAAKAVPVKKSTTAVPVKKSTTAVPVKKKSTAVPVKVTKKTQKRR